MRGNHEITPQRSFISAILFCAIRDSVYWHPAPPQHSMNPNTRKSRYYRSMNARKNREEARAWIREASTARTTETLGFGYIWDMLTHLGAVEWSIEDFISNMEKLWSAADKDHAIGARIIKHMGWLFIETADGKRAKLDRDAEFQKAKAMA